MLHKIFSYFLAFVFCTILIDTSIGQTTCNIGNIEVIVCNQSSESIKVQFYPVSAIFNDKNQYSLFAKGRVNQSPNVANFDYLTTVYYNYPDINAQRFVIVSPGSSAGYEYDIEINNSHNSLGKFGYGVYKLVLTKIDGIGYEGEKDSCLIDFDYYNNNNVSLSGDLFIVINDNNVTPRFFYKFSIPGALPISLSYSNVEDYTIRSWDPNKNINDPLYRNKIFGPSDGFELKILPDVIENQFNFLPLDSRRDCGWNYSNVNQNHMFALDSYEERHGFFSLNCVIKKSIKTPFSRADFSILEEATDVVIMPGVTFTIDKGNPGNSDSYTEYHLKNYSDYTGTNFIVQGPNPEFSGATLKLNHSEVYETNARMRFEEKCKLTLEQGSITIIEKYGNLIFENGGEMFMHENSNITFYDHGEIIINSGGKVFNCGANITNNSNVCILVNNGGQYHIGSEFCNNNVEHLFDNGSFLVVKNGGELRVADNSKIIFDGLNSFLKAEQGGIIKMGANSSIEFRNGAYLDADGITFSGDSGAIWGGLVFHNAGGQTQIKNCTFNDAKISIDIKNTTGCYADLEKRITGNTFNQPSIGSHSIRAENVFKLLLQGNTFNIAAQKIGVAVSNTINAGLPSEGGEGAGFPCINTSYNLNILGNTFNNGGMQLYLNCFASEVTPFMVQGNGFYNYNISDLTSISIAGRKVSGDFKQNNFSSSGNSIGTNVVLLQSSVNMFNNLLQSANLQNIWANTSSSCKMSPVYQNGQWIWLSGYNNLSSIKYNVLVTGGSALPTLDYGKNCFLIPTQGQDKYHISGFGIQWNFAQQQIYYIRENSWYGWMGSNIPALNIKNHENQPIPYLHTPTILCPSTSWDGYTTQDIGFGIYDTIYYNNIGYPPEFEEDQELYNQAIYGYYEGDYLTSINTFKILIQGHPKSDYTESCLYDFYDNYRALDTSSAQSYTDNLYSDLKNFLSAIILAESHSENFNYTAYEIIQMCEVNMRKYNDALAGYEFIAMYHPDPEARFLASADHQEILEMLGEGQGIMNLSAEEKYKRLKKKLNSFFKSDPVTQKIIRQFENQLNKKVINKTSIDSKELSSREVREMSRNEKENKVYNRTQKDLINKSNTLLLSGRSMSKEERRNIVCEGILLIAGMTKGDEISENAIAPSSYSLNQNYPNPFNPVTNIRFDIMKAGKVRLSVYDITGKEVSVLTNEVLKPGSYEVGFDASHLSSGVYYYRIEAGEFTQSRKMLLVK